MNLAALNALALPLAAPSSGVVSAAELRLAGADRHAVSRASRSAWQRPLTGIYVVDGRPITEPVRAHIAVKHAGPGAVVTGLLACRWHGLRWVPESTAVHVLVDPDRRRQSSNLWVLVRRFADLDQLETSAAHGLRVAPVAQAVVDGARELGSLRDVRGLVLGAVADKRCTTEELREILDRGAVAGTALARRACLDADRGAASPPEAELVDRLLRTGVPFYCNVEVWVGEQLLGIADVWLVGTGVGGELDSKECHGDADPLDRTLVRDKRFVRAGLDLGHISPRRFRDNPDGYCATLLAEAARRAALGLQEPEGLRLVPRGPLLQGSLRAKRPYPSSRPARP
jgi:hypothetical protein